MKVLFTYCHHDGSRATVIALRCDTDFTARTKEFKELGENLAMSLAALDDSIAIKNLDNIPYALDDSLSIKDIIDKARKTFKENIKLIVFYKLKFENNILLENIDYDFHEDICKFKIAAFGASGIECEHGYDTCPTCDPCTCRKE